MGHSAHSYYTYYRTYNIIIQVKIPNLPIIVVVGNLMVACMHACIWWLHYCIGFLNKTLVKGLLKECMKMQQFDHPNVLKLTGVCMDGGPSPYLVMPFMMNGSLLTYLKKQRDMLVISQDNSDEDLVLNLTTNIPGPVT